MPTTIKEIGTPSAYWRATSSSDPFKDEYDCKLERITYGSLTHEEMADKLRYVWNSGDYGAVLAGARERIRWLSRQLHKLESDEQRIANNLARSELNMGECSDDELANIIYKADGANTVAMSRQNAGAERIEWLAKMITKLNNY